MNDLCNHEFDCRNEKDEVKCLHQKRYEYNDRNLVLSQPPIIVDLDSAKRLKARAVVNSKTFCHDLKTHFMCVTQLICLPVYLRCNKIWDCLHGEDEFGCESFTCPGFYRCRQSQVCLHPRHLCDKVPQCPNGDDELLCSSWSCPNGCTCYGLSNFCTLPVKGSLHQELRFLEARASGLTPANVRECSMLVYLGLAECSLTSVELPALPNLLQLDLSDNHLTSLTSQHFLPANNLRLLSLAGNPLKSVLVRDPNMTSPLNLQLLDLSRVTMETLDIQNFVDLSSLNILNLSDSAVDIVKSPGLQQLKLLTVADFHGCPMTVFPGDIFKGLLQLQTIFADNYKLCCPAILPRSSSQLKCHAPENELSSCSALLRSDIYRALLALFATLALLGNLASTVFRLFINKTKKIGFDVFVTSLSLSDFLMGFYLAIIGVADRLYQGSYLWNDSEWRHSSVCKTAGFVCLLSCEVSVMIICLITVERFFVLRFPLSHLRFSAYSALLACGIVWAMGLIVAAIPLLPFTKHWNFYSQTGLCIPLPITRTTFPGHEYSFSVLVVVNFVLFLIVAIGQVFIYLSVRNNAIKISETSKRRNDAALARRLITVAVSDFLCWFPIGVLGLLSSRGVPIPGEINVAAAILALPINAAINPFLYTLNMLLERKRKELEERMVKVLLAQHQNREKTHQ